MSGPIAWLQQRRATRRQRDEAVIAGLLVRSAGLTALTLTQTSGLRHGRAYAAIARMERDGRITSDWQPGPYPRRRLYRLAGGADGR